MSRKKKIFVLLGIIVMGFACIGISCKKKTYVDEYAYRESCIEKKREDFFNLMTECKNMFTYQQYEITLEKSYYDACAGEGCVLVSVKTNGTENFETDAFFDNKTGTLYFERTESGDWRYELHIINDEASFEIIDNSIYITACVDVNNGTYYSKENKGIVLVDCEKENEEDKNCPGLSFPNNTVAKEIEIEKGKKIYITHSALVSEEEVFDLSINFNNGKEMLLHKAGEDTGNKVINVSYYENLTNFSFNELINVETIKSIRLNGEVYELQ